MELKYKLLEHPFYQAWTKGEITTEQLAQYHKSYKEFIELMPHFWADILNTFNENTADSDHIIKDETEHIELWNKWAGKLPLVKEFPRMIEIINEIEKMSPSEKLGAIQAFELQQPEVARTKKDGLLEHYGYEEKELTYFDEHMKEEHHIKYGYSLRDKYANTNEYRNGFERGSEIFYKGLDLFMN